MLKKIGIMPLTMIIVGAVLLPGAPLLNNVIRDLTYTKVDEGLLGIKEQGLGTVEESIYEMGPATALDMITEIGTATSGPLVNATIFMGQVYTVQALQLKYVNQSSLKIPDVESLFFNWDASLNIVGTVWFTFSGIANLGNYPALLGVAEWYETVNPGGGNLDFSTSNITYFGSYGNYTGLMNLKCGVDASGWWGDRLPGIFEDSRTRVGSANWPPTPANITGLNATVDMNKDRGFGVIKLMNLIENATDDELIEMAGPGGYNLSTPIDLFPYNNGTGTYNFNKLKILYYYYTRYFVSEALVWILDQPDGDEDPGYSINDKNSNLYKQYPQYQPRDWNGDYTNYTDLGYYSMVEQWAKCASYDDGADFSEFDPRFPPDTRGLEPAGPGVDSGIPMQAALQLFNASCKYSLTNFTGGIGTWHKAHLNRGGSAYNELLAYFENFPGYTYENKTYGNFGWGFNETDMDLILNWLWGTGAGWPQSFSHGVLPTLLEAQYGMPLEDFCFTVLLEQWANATNLGYKLYPQGFPLPLGAVTKYGLEVGYQGPGIDVIPTNMSLESALLLWNTTNENSLVTPASIQKWFAAVGGDASTKATLQAANKLDDTTMNMLLAWIPDFQQNVMPFLAQYQYNLPMDTITLGGIIQVGGLVMGIALVALGAFAMRRRVLKSRTLGA